jgi:saccharopine dehydrogenase-like NADP-dependent oxidoreductase
MFEKTLRYPGHVDLMRIFRNAGFLGMTPIQERKKRGTDQKKDMSPFLS